MNLGGGSSGVRIAPAALKLDLYDELDGGHFVVERQEQSGWLRVGVFGTLKDAGEFIDGEVGQGHGALHDYEIEHVPSPDEGWRKWGRRTVIALGILAAIGLFILFIGPGR